MTSRPTGVLLRTSIVEHRRRLETRRRLTPVQRYTSSRKDEASDELLPDHRSRTELAGLLGGDIGRRGSRTDDELGLDKVGDVAR